MAEETKLIFKFYQQDMKNTLQSQNRLKGQINKNDSLKYVWKIQNVPRSYC